MIRICGRKEKKQTFNHLFGKNHENIKAQENISFDYFLQSTAWATRGTYHTTLQATPYQYCYA
jgi:hypothetical protein